MKKSTDRIILVEDNPADVQLARLAFQENGITNEIYHCPTGESLLNLLPNLHPSEVPYILLDLNMPGMGGIELLKTLRQTDGWNLIPVIIFTTSTHDADVKSCYLAGANSYVVKPIEYNAFHSNIKAIHRFWGELNVRG